MTTIRTEDGKHLETGSRAFNYYDRKWGTIGADIARDGWFDFHHDDGTTSLLNGERIATYDPQNPNAHKTPTQKATNMTEPRTLNDIERQMVELAKSALSDLCNDYRAKFASYEAANATNSKQKDSALLQAALAVDVDVDDRHTINETLAVLNSLVDYHDTETTDRETIGRFYTHVGQSLLNMAIMFSDMAVAYLTELPSDRGYSEVTKADLQTAYAECVKYYETVVSYSGDPRSCGQPVKLRKGKGGTSTLVLDLPKVRITAKDGAPKSEGVTDQIKLYVNGELANEEGTYEEAVLKIFELTPEKFVQRFNAQGGSVDSYGVTQTFQPHGDEYGRTYSLRFELQD